MGSCLILQKCLALRKLELVFTSWSAESALSLVIAIDRSRENVDSIITALHVVLKVKVVDELKGNCSGWWELDLPQAGGEGLVVGDFDAAGVLGEGLLALGLALVVAGVGHADWVVE